MRRVHATRDTTNERYNVTKVLGVSEKHHGTEAYMLKEFKCFVITDGTFKHLALLSQL